MKNILASALRIGDRVDGSILPALRLHPLAAHQLFTVCYVGHEGADLVHVEFEGRGPQRAIPGRVVPGSFFPPLFERNDVISIAGLPDQCQHNAHFSQVGKP